MTKMVRIALAQLSPHLREPEANIDTVRRVAAQHPEADLIAFPELFLSGYTVTDVDGLAVRLDDPELESLADVAREHSTALIVGAAERVSDGVANSAICMDERGDLVAVYHKVQLYGGDESDAFVAGDELLVAELCGVKVGLMICFDVEFPEVARALARAGAELLVTISANMEPFGNDQADPTGETVLDTRLSLPVKSSVREDYLSQLRSPMPQVRNVAAGTRPEAR